MKDWPEKPYLEPKTAGRTYLEWLYYRERAEGRTPHGRAPSSCASSIARTSPSSAACSSRRLYRHGAAASAGGTSSQPGVAGKRSRSHSRASSRTGWCRSHHSLKAGRTRRAWGSTMKLIIAGSRTFTDYQLLCQTLAPERHRITQVITGGARGADQLGYRWAWKHQVKHQLFPR